MIVKEDIISLFLNNFSYEPTSGQHKLIDKLADFLLYRSNQSLFVLRGYAGTGKTSIVSTLVNILPHLKGRSVLMAPTGRAAKVLTSYSGQRAYTIHKKIYLLTSRPDGTSMLTLFDNPHRHTLFIIDEASMIPESPPPENFSMFASRNLLDDLINYVYQGENCRLLLIGDTAQLPPVGLDISPALDLEFLKATYGFEMFSMELKEVVRQSFQSGILSNATALRNMIGIGEIPFPLFHLKQHDDIVNITGIELEDAINTAYSRSGLENTIIITRSNKRANLFNQEIRNRMLFRDNEISAGDIMMVVKNNYYWLDNTSRAGFVANGDLIEVMQIRKTEELYGFRFADITFRLIDYPDEKTIDALVLLDTITVEGPALSNKDHRRLFDEVIQDYEEETSQRKRIDKVKNNPYYNALQVKFAYALTCHKTQGGQWPTVFIDQGYLTEEMVNKEYLRWLYTATTRATEKVYLVNFRDQFVG